MCPSRDTFRVPTDLVTRPVLMIATKQPDHQIVFIHYGTLECAVEMIGLPYAKAHARKALPAAFSHEFEVDLPVTTFLSTQVGFRRIANILVIRHTPPLLAIR